MEGFDLNYIKKKELDEGMNPIANNNNSQPNKKDQISIEELLNSLNKGAIQNSNEQNVDDIYESFKRRVEEVCNEKGRSNVEPEESDIYDAFIRCVEEDGSEKGRSR